MKEQNLSLHLGIDKSLLAVFFLIASGKWNKIKLFIKDLNSHVANFQNT